MKQAEKKASTWIEFLRYLFFSIFIFFLAVSIYVSRPPFGLKRLNFLQNQTASHEPIEKAVEEIDIPPQPETEEADSLLDYLLPLPRVSVNQPTEEHLKDEEIDYAE
jgi:hypothetical protein